MGSTELTSPPSTSEATDPTPRTPAVMLAWTGVLWLACTLATAVVSELGRPGGVDLIRPTFSELIFTSVGARLAGVSMVSLACASVCIAFALVCRQAPSERLALSLIAAWAGALVLAAGFPMAPAGGPTTWYDALHRYAAVVGLICLPVAGLRLARRFRTAPDWQSNAMLLRVFSVAGLAGTIAFLATFASTTAPVWLYGARQYSGITERVTLVADIVLLAILAAAVLKPVAPPE
jgi:hypothetical protein